MVKLLHLQGIRGVAICAVIAFHYFPEYCPNGYLGVDIFFVLSGYLMSMMLARHSTLSWPTVAEFLYRRGKRILPLYHLVIMTSLGLVYFCPCSQLIPNMISAARAMFLSTNLNTGDDYFQKLGAAHDFFTHTWSLCLEMQFYLIFPLLWWLQIRFSQNKQIALLHIISGASLYLYFMVDSKQAFNNVFCRIWQFLLGNMVYCLEEYSDEPIFDAEKSEKKEKHETFYWIFTSLSLILLLFSIVTKIQLSQDYSRTAITILSTILIFCGRGMTLLENRGITFLGDISYAWYLFHWPLLTLQQIFGYTAFTDMVGGVVISFLVSVAVHHSIEKLYLGWEKPLTVTVIVVLFLSCIGLLFLDRSRLPQCVATPILRPDYLTMPIEEKKVYFTSLMEHDQYQLVDNRCDFDLPKELSSSFYNYRADTWIKSFTTPAFEGTCKYTNTTQSNNQTIALIGNSWTANSSPLVFDECGKYFGNIYRTSYTECEVFRAMDSDHCLASERAYFDVVERLKPDYLFLLHRYFYIKEIGSDEEWQEIVKEATRRLTLLATYVKKKIFILRPFPVAFIDRHVVIAALDNGTPIDYTKTPNNRPLAITTPQKLLNQIITSCSKCEHIDFTPQFTINGTFYPYDPESLMPFVNQGMHFTQPGLERIRPLFTDICQKIGN